jgi:iron-sulfur cluster repair protein YtfE (RIC family)
MTAGCRCCSHETAPAPLAIEARRPAAVKPSDTVQAVSDRSPRALETMKALGINHCCGAHLSLAEAAASAGVPLATLMTHLDEAFAAEATR